MSDTPRDNPPPQPTIEPPLLREFSDRSTLYLLEDPMNLRDLLRIHSPELVERLDFTQAQRINRSLISPALQKKEADLIFRVPFLPQSNSAEQAEPPLAIWIYLLLEHQSKPDDTMTFRLLSYMLALWVSQQQEWDDHHVPASQRKLTPIVPFVFYTGRHKWKTPLAFRDMFEVPPGFERFIPSWETLFLNLHKTPPETLTTIFSAIGWALRAMQVEKAPYEKIEQTLRDAMQALNTSLSEEQVGQWARIGTFLIRLVQYRLKDPAGSPLYNLILEEARQSKFAEREETRAMYTMADRLMDEGRAEGIAKGREEGRLSLRAMLEQILVTKFGALPETVKQRIADADLDTLQGWGFAATVATTLAEVGIESAN